jgi:hypothetical protein
MSHQLPKYMNISRGRDVSTGLERADVPAAAAAQAAGRGAGLSDPRAWRLPASHRALCRPRRPASGGGDGQGAVRARGATSDRMHPRMRGGCGRPAPGWRAAWYLELARSRACICAPMRAPQGSVGPGQGPTLHDAARPRPTVPQQSADDGSPGCRSAQLHATGCCRPGKQVDCAAAIAVVSVVMWPSPADRPGLPGRIRKEAGGSWVLLLARVPTCCVTPRPQYGCQAG